MIVLTTETLSFKLAGSITTNPVSCRVSYSDKQYSPSYTYNGKSQQSESNNTTLVDCCDAPTSPIVRDIDNAEWRNADTANAQVLIYLGSVNIIDVVLSPNDVLFYTHANGWRKIDSTGAIVGVGATGPAGPGVPTGGTTGQILAKIDNTDYNDEWIDPPTSATLPQYQIGVGNASNLLSGSSNLTFNDLLFKLIANVGVGSGWGQIQHLLQSSSSEAGISLENTSAGGKIYNLISTGAGSGIGAGGFSIGNATDGRNIFNVDTNGNITLSPAATELLAKFGSTAGTFHQLSYDDGAQFISTLAIGDLTGLSLPAFFGMLKIEDTVNSFVNLLKANADSFINEVTDGTVTAKMHNTLAHSHFSWNDGSDLFEIGVDSGGVFITHNAVTWRWPLADGSSGDVLTTDGAGNMSWAAAASPITPAALTKVDDTNVTLSLGGTPATSLLQSVSLTLGWTGTLADGRIASAGTWNAKIGGSGTTNEIAYFTASGTIASLTVATYPSLTELSYVKGVSSAIQAQLNAKQTAYTILSTLGVLANAAGVLTNDGAGNLSWVAAGNTLYTGNGTLASDRTVTLNSKFLKIVQGTDNLIEIDPVGRYSGIGAYNSGRVANLDLYAAASGDTITKFRLYSYKTTDVELTGDAEAQTMSFRAALGYYLLTGMSVSASSDDKMVVFDSTTKQLNYRTIPTGSDYTNSFLLGGM